MGDRTSGDQMGSGPNESQPLGDMFLWLVANLKQEVIYFIKHRDAPRVKNPGGAGSNAARRRCPAAPSDLPKSGGAAAPPAPPLGASLETDGKQTCCCMILDLIVADCNLLLRNIQKIVLRLDDYSLRV